MWQEENNKCERGSDVEGQLWEQEEQGYNEQERNSH
jgi:hypothetical protein